MERVAGVDVAYWEDRYWSALVTFADGRLDPIVSNTGLSPDPYVSGLFFLKEAPLISRLIHGRPIDLLFVNGHGICHPFRYGLAVAVGITHRVRTIGVARRLIKGDYGRMATTCAGVELITQAGRVTGAAVRRTPGGAELFVSPGFGLTVDQAITEHLKWVKGGKAPEPLRLAHINAKAMRRKEEGRGERGE